MTDDTAPDVTGAFGQRVARGAALLDELVPGWVTEVDLAWLKLADCSECVLGQVFDNYTFAVKLLGLEDPASYGFDLAPEESDDDWPDLNAAWHSLILARKAADASAQP